MENAFHNDFYFCVKHVIFQQIQPPSNHQIGPQQGPQVHVPSRQASVGRHIPPPQGASSQIPQQVPPAQIGLPPVPQSHMGPLSGTMASGSHVTPTGPVIGLPSQMGSQQPSTLPGTSPMLIGAQSTSFIQGPAGCQNTNSIGPIPVTSQGLVPSGPQGPSGPIPTMQNVAQMPTAQSVPYQPTSTSAVIVNEVPQEPEDTKPKTAELISFD